MLAFCHAAGVPITTPPPLARHGISRYLTLDLLHVLIRCMLLAQIGHEGDRPVGDGMVGTEPYPIARLWQRSLSWDQEEGWLGRAPGFGQGAVFVAR